MRSAFGDPRFAPLEPPEWDDVSLSVTLLSPLQPMSFESEADLLSQMQPHRDGLVIECREPVWRENAFSVKSIT